MKLLSKSEVNLQATVQRKSEIDNGIYLATRVDKLRADLLTLEQQQQQFIEGNKRVIRDALKDLQDKKYEEERQLTLIARERKKLLEPLDKEWAKVDASRKEIDALNKEIKEQQEIYDNNIKESQKNLNEAKQEKHRASTANETAQEFLREADSKHKKATERLAEIESHVENIELDISERLRLLKDREARLEYDRKHYLDFEENIRQKEKDIALREKRLVIRELKQKV